MKAPTNTPRESHETESDYCCACEYDVACFENKLKEARREVVEEAAQLWDEGVRNPKGRTPQQLFDDVVQALTKIK